MFELLLPALHGVAAAHREGVIHRDLKPDNIFLCRGADAEPQPVKVLDFGISAIRSLGQTTLTTEGTVLGTPSYMAPEQTNHAAQADERTDVYAFGVIVYEALTGRLPFKHDNFLSLALAIAREDPIPPRQLQATVPLDLERLVLQALQRNPGQRPQTIHDLTVRLRACAKAGQESARHSGRPLAAFRSLPLWAAALGILALGTLLFWSASAGRPAPERSASGRRLSAAVSPATVADVDSAADMEPARPNTPLVPARVDSAANPGERPGLTTARPRTRRVTPKRASASVEEPRAVAAPARNNRTGAILAEEL